MHTLTDEHVLAAYVDGSDLHEVAPLLRSRLQDFVARRHWCTNQVLFIDQVYEPDPQCPGCLPDWDLGLNVGLDHVHRTDRWFGDVEALVRFLEKLHAESGRHFVLFLASHSRHWLTEHLCFVQGKPVELPWLREVIQRLTNRGS